MFEIFCGSKEAMVSVANRGVTGLNPKTIKWQIIDKTAKYNVREDETFKDDKGQSHICATLLSDINLKQIAEEKRLIL
ncbi:MULTISPECIES: hypothetical protein [Clostridium]|jgi:hypothetical protein|uniref:hypothetical protein n=1 Tax=Clostridium TaxID=1485 RepID=UPI00242CB77B|nr:hypothetical protein [Clostridium tyrobutyricum]